MVIIDLRCCRKQRDVHAACVFAFLDILGPPLHPAWSSHAASRTGTNQDDTRGQGYEEMKQMQQKGASGLRARPRGEVDKGALRSMLCSVEIKRHRKPYSRRN